MIDPGAFLHIVITPGCRILSAVAEWEMSSDEARILLLAIAMQESGLEYRRQIGADGQPIDTLARGFWQFEAGGGVAGVMNHPDSENYAGFICSRLYVEWDQDTIHEAIAWNGYLAAIFARLLLWTDAAALPAIGAQDEAWDYYIRNWRPGKPHPETWSSNYQTAVRLVT